MSGVVLDTNVLASGAVRRDIESPPVRLVDAWQAEAFTLIVSAHLRAEVARTLNQPYFQARVTPAQAARFLSLLDRQAVLAPITVEVRGVATHPEDDLILATAVSGRADYLVTGDRQLQRPGSYQGVTILSPRAFLDWLNGQGPGGSER